RLVLCRFPVGARAARGRRRAGEVGGRRAAATSRVRLRVCASTPLHLARRPVGPRRVLGTHALLAARRRGARPSSRRGGLRRRAHGGVVAWVDGGSAPQWAARRERGRAVARGARLTGAADYFCAASCCTTASTRAKPLFEPSSTPYCIVVSRSSAEANRIVCV